MFTSLCIGTRCRPYGYMKGTTTHACKPSTCAFCTFAGHRSFISRNRTLRSNLYEITVVPGTTSGKTGLSLMMTKCFQRPNLTEAPCVLQHSIYDKDANIQGSKYFIVRQGIVICYTACRPISGERKHYNQHKQHKLHALIKVFKRANKSRTK